MVANPMQKRTRNSFLLGMMITLIICLLLFAAFYFLIMNKNKEKEEERGIEVTAYVLNQDVKSGQTITSNMFSQITVYSNMVPSNYITQQTVSELMPQDIDGNILYTANQNNEEVMYIEVNQQNSEGYTTVGTPSNGKVKIRIDMDSSGYYRTKQGQKEYIEFYDVPVIAKVDMKQNTILTSSVINKSNQVTTDDVRYVEYNMLVLPTTIAEGDYIDIRLTLPNGQDLIVVSKKEVKSLLGDTVGLELSEGEILMMENAIVEAYIMSSSKLYAIQYIEPGMQDAALKTYTPTEEVENLIRANGNIKNEAKNALVSRFDKNMREYINRSKNLYSEEGQANLEEGIQEQIENAKAAREAYLSGLTSYSESSSSGTETSN